jgi:glutamyl/glutaminyl-tRNA synthetase
MQIDLLEFWTRLKYNAPVNLRFDDTNPAKKSRNMLMLSKKICNGWVSIGLKNAMHLIISNN